MQSKVRSCGVSGSSVMAKTQGREVQFTSVIFCCQTSGKHCETSRIPLATLQLGALCADSWTPAENLFCSLETEHLEEISVREWYE